MSTCCTLRIKFKDQWRPRPVGSSQRYTTQSIIIKWLTTSNRKQPRIKKKQRTKQTAFEMAGFSHLIGPHIRGLDRARTRRTRAHAYSLPSRRPPRPPRVHRVGATSDQQGTLRPWPCGPSPPWTRVDAAGHPWSRVGPTVFALLFISSRSVHCRVDFAVWFFALGFCFGGENNLFCVDGSSVCQNW